MHIIEYKLKFLLNSLTLKIKNIVDLTDSAKILEFNNTHCDTKKIQGFCTKIDKITKFPLLNVPLAEDGGIKHRVLFCEVAVGNSLFVNRHYAENIDPPTGIDSLITDGTNDVSYLVDTKIDVKACSYVIKDSKKILPLYEITFEYDPDFERRSRGKNICDRCKESEAVVFCPSEIANFCEECDKQVHSDKFLSIHERKYFSDVRQKKFIRCGYHQNKTVEYFCDECFEPICTECQIGGRHSSKEFSEHKIKPFLDACRSAYDSVDEGCAALERIENGLKNDILRFKDSVGSFKGNISSLKEAMENKFKILMQQLDIIESDQRQYLNAKLVDYVCKSEMIKQMIAYPAELDPADLLLGLKNVVEQRKPEKLPVTEKAEFKKYEAHGKITIFEPKTAEPRIASSKSEDISAGWRVETMNLDLKAENTLN